MSFHNAKKRVGKRRLRMEGGHSEEIKNLLHLLKVLWIFSQIEKGWSVTKTGPRTYEFTKEQEVQSFVY